VHLHRRLSPAKTSSVSHSFNTVLNVPRRNQPRITPEMKRRSVDAIAARRHSRRCDDPKLAELTDDPVQIARYVAETDPERIGHDIVAADVLDALTLLEWSRAHVPALPWVYEDIEHRLLEQGRVVRLTYQAMAAPLGLRSPQAVEQRLLRGRNAADGGPRREQVERASRRAAAERPAAHRSQSGGDATLVASYAGELHDCVAMLRAYREPMLTAVAKISQGDEALIQPEIMLEILLDGAERISQPQSTDYVDRVEALAAQSRTLLPSLERAAASDPQLRQEPRLAEALGRLRLLTRSYRSGPRPGPG
jgi:hypothetical protein